MTDSPTTTEGGGHFSLRRRILFGAIAFIAATIAALVLAEVLLRVLPIRGLAYQTFYYDELTGGHHYPNATVVYRASDGREISRRVNDWGFLDADHSQAKPPGTVRIGFFGDSYTEARQVELEDTFFRQLESRLREPRGDGGDGTRYEMLAFGVAGRSTLQSWLECTRWMERADLDAVVYVFSENDPADQLREVSAIDVVPFAELSGDTFVVDDAFRRRYRYKTSPLRRLARFLRARSLVMSTIEQRLRLLRRHGAALRVDRPLVVDAREAGLRATAPSTWPAEMVSYAETLGERIIRRWQEEVESSGRRFVIARVPRESQLHRTLDEQDAWAAWLHRVCARYDIPLIDPTDELRAVVAAGKPPYGDHLTEAGHRAFVRALADGLAGAGVIPALGDRPFQ